MAKAKEVAVKNAQELVAVPDYIKQGGTRGNENITNEDLQLPRLAIIQDLSPQKDKDDEKYIEGAEIGMLFNTLTGELYETVTFTPVSFQKRWFVWKDQDEGGGLQGIFSNTEQQQAEALAAKLNGDMEVPIYEAVLTHEHLVMLSDGSEIILSCSKSKLKVSKKFNSLVRLNGGDRFGRNYTVSVSRETNPNNNKKYYNFKIDSAGGAQAFPSQEVYEAAEALYATILEGLAYGGDYEEDRVVNTQLDDEGNPVVADY